jgi:cell division protein FtsZ
MMIRFAEDGSDRAKIAVVGVGGAGGNAVSRMVAAGIPGVEFVAANTDIQALGLNAAPAKMQLGRDFTRGLGSGGNPQVGRHAAESDVDVIRETVEGMDMVFLTAGMGGGTGTGASPVVARVAREAGALTVGVVTKPFDFEGPVRRRRAEEGIAALKAAVDTLIVIPNQRLLSVVDQDTPLDQAFAVADDVLLRAVRGICELITRPGLINLDFNDVRSVMAEMGDALMGSGSATGEGRAIEAAQRAVSCPLLEDVSMSGARGVIVNVTGSRSMTLHEVSAAVSVVRDASGADADVFFGAVVDDEVGEAINVTVIATGISIPRPNVKEETLAEVRPISTLRRHAGDELLRPAYRRHREDRGGLESLDPAASGAGGGSGGSGGGQVRVLADEDLETPAFLRRRID